MSASPSSSGGSGGRRNSLIRGGQKCLALDLSREMRW
jgi:hypothetical protein